MQTVAGQSARIAFDHTSLTLSLHELEYLVLNLTAVADQMAWYKVAEADVSAQVQCAARTTTFIPSNES